MKADYYLEGDWNALCSMCGGKFKAGELRKHWQGQYRCDRCWEPRHPQDFVKAAVDEETPPWTQPPADNIIAACTPSGMSAVPGEAEPGCVVPGYLSPMFVQGVD